MTSQVDILRARVRAVAIEVTSKCNLRCTYCYKADDLMEALPGANEDMSDEMIRGLYRYCRDSGIRRVVLSAVGETTMTAGWQHRIAQFIEDTSMETFMVSNFARLFNEDDLDALAKIGSLQISFDSSDVEMVRKLRSRADLRTITYNIIRLRQKGRELDRHQHLTVNCVVCRDNISHIAKLAGFCRELGIDQFMLTGVVTLGQHNPNMPETLGRLSDHEVVLLARQIADAEKILGDDVELVLHERLSVQIEALVKQIHQGKNPVNAAAHFYRRMDVSACRQPWELPIVRANGHILPCCGFDPAQPVGTLADATIHEIFESSAMRSIRSSILEGRPIVNCQNCTFARPVSFSEFARDIEEWQGDNTIPNAPAGT